jgi:N-acetylneuraminic acid mutarotase
MKTKFQFIFLTGFSLFVLGFISCLFDEAAGTASETDNVSTIAGRLVDEDNNPVNNAKVQIISVDHNPYSTLSKKSEVVDIAYTDEKGEFRTDSLPDGTYNVLGEKDENLCFKDSVEVSKDSATELPDNVLKDPGSLSGVIRLQPNHDSRTVFILVFGTNTFTVPTDSIGNFTLENMAEGKYSVRILTTLDDYTPKDTILTIISGASKTLPDTLSLDFTGIPTPTGLKVFYDTLMQAVTLTWSPNMKSDISGYNVYRKHKDSNYIQINIGIVEDTVFVDSLNGGSVYDAIYFYHVTALDLNNNEGFKSIEVTISVIGKSIGWLTKSAIPPRTGHFLCAVNDILYSVGGMDGIGVLLKLDKYNIAQDTWEALAPIPEPRDGASAVGAAGKIYYFGGGQSPWKVSNYEYNPSSNTWLKKSNDCVAGRNMACCQYNDTVYVIGGERIKIGISNSVHTYDPQSDTWTAKSSMNTARTKLAVCAVNGKIYAIGGTDGSSALNVVEEYDPQRDQWTTKAPMPTARMSLACTEAGGRIYAIGGDNGNNSLNTVEEYDPQQDSWTVKSPMPTSRMGLGANSVNGRIYAIGGYDGLTFLGTVEEYNPLLDN